MSEILLRGCQFGVHPIAGRIGAEIAGVRLSRRLPAKVLNASERGPLGAIKRLAPAGFGSGQEAVMTKLTRPDTIVLDAGPRQDPGRSRFSPDLSCARGFDDKR